tara:strand:- start:17241 stop:19421 length:2181 start_codon:yes stop_codon:yes gene_type:complete
MKVFFTALIISLFSFNGFAQFEEFEDFNLYGELIFGVVNSVSGDTLVPGKYDGMDLSRKELGLFSVYRGELYGVLNKDGKEIIPLIYSRVDVFENGFIRVKKGGDYYEGGDDAQFGMYNSNGKKIIETNYGYLGEVSDGLIRANMGGNAYLDGDGLFSGENDEITGGKWGFLDTKGKIKIPFDLTYARNFKDGLAKVYIGGKNDDWVYDGKWTYIKTNGLPFVSDDLGVESDVIGGLLIVSKRETIIEKDEYDSWFETKTSFGVVNTKGKIIFEPKYKNISFFDGRFIILHEIDTIKNVPNFSIYDVDLNPIGELGYQSVEPRKWYDENTESSHTRFIISKNQKFGIINSVGKNVLPVEYSSIDLGYEPFMNVRKGGVIATRDYDGEKKYNGLCGLVNWNGKMVLPLQYDEIYMPESFNEKLLFICRKSGKWGIVDSLNNTILPFDFDTLESINRWSYETHMYTAIKDGKWGVVDLSGKDLIPFKFDEFKSVYMLDAMGEDMIGVVYKGNEGIINSKGDFRFPAKFKHISTDNWAENRVLFYSNEIFGVADTLGNILVPMEYESITFLSNGEIVLKKTINKVVNLNLKNQEVGEYSQVNSWNCYSLQLDEVHSQNICAIQKNGKWGFTNFTTGEELFKPQFDEIGDETYCDVSMVRIGKKFGLVSLKGGMKLPLNFDEMSFGYCNYETGLIPVYVKKDNLWGLYLSNGELKYALKYKTKEEVPSEY